MASFTATDQPPLGTSKTAQQMVVTQNLVFDLRFI
jgi:hypothetical protein